MLNRDNVNALGNSIYNLFYPKSPSQELLTYQKQHLFNKQCEITLLDYPLEIIPLQQQKLILCYPDQQKFLVDFSSDTPVTTRLDLPNARAHIFPFPNGNFLFQESFNQLPPKDDDIYLYQPNENKVSFSKIKLTNTNLSLNYGTNYLLNENEILCLGNLKHKNRGVFIYNIANFNKCVASLDLRGVSNLENYFPYFFPIQDNQFVALFNDKVTFYERQNNLFAKIATNNLAYLKDHHNANLPVAKTAEERLDLLVHNPECKYLDFKKINDKYIEINLMNSFWCVNKYLFEIKDFNLKQVYHFSRHEICNGIFDLEDGSNYLITTLCQLDATSNTRFFRVNIIDTTTFAKKYVYSFQGPHQIFVHNLGKGHIGLVEDNKLNIYKFKAILIPQPKDEKIIANNAPSIK